MSYSEQLSTLTRNFRTSSLYGLRIDTRVLAPLLIGAQTSHEYLFDEVYQSLYQQLSLRRDSFKSTNNSFYWDAISALEALEVFVIQVQSIIEGENNE